ncbi:hypothetical protein [Thiohalocapsa marina]|uniref:hypothetical protein n=1 Tax=Thiohalocapsa marina TaxID=424902 RepID=UPI0036DAF283
MILIMFALQQAQVSVFLRAHELRPGWLYPALFNARRGILNTLLPARSGTFLLMRGLTERYGVQWQHFLLFFVLASLMSVYVSAIALVWVIWPWAYSVGMLTASAALCAILSRRSRFRYAATLPSLLLLAIGLYLANTILLFCVLRGIGYGVCLTEAAYLAVVLNILAQISITPGNLGVREIVMGAIAPHFGLPIAVGILASSLMVVLRLGLYGVLWGVLEWMNRSRSTGAFN